MIELFKEYSQIILTIVGFVSLYVSLKKSISKDISGLSWKIDQMDKELKEIKVHIRSIDQRLNHLEGAFEERGRWESRRTGTDRE